MPATTVPIGFTSERRPPVGPLRMRTFMPSRTTSVGFIISAKSETMEWMCWWNWLRRPPSRPYQFFVVIEAWQRLWSLHGATPMTLVAFLKGSWKKVQFRRISPSSWRGEKDSVSGIEEIEVEIVGDLRAGRS